MIQTTLHVCSAYLHLFCITEHYDFQSFAIFCELDTLQPLKWNHAYRIHLGATLSVYYSICACVYACPVCLHLQISSNTLYICAHACVHVCSCVCFLVCPNSFVHAYTCKQVYQYACVHVCEYVCVTCCAPNPL